MTPLTRLLVYPAFGRIARRTKFLKREQLSHVVDNAGGRAFPPFFEFVSHAQ